MTFGDLTIPDYFTETLGNLMLDASALEAVARAFDREEAAQMGEPDPWDSAEENADNEWLQERMCCALVALEALSDYWASLDRKAQP